MKQTNFLTEQLPLILGWQTHPFCVTLVDVFSFLPVSGQRPIPGKYRYTGVDTLKAETIPNHQIEESLPVKVEEDIKPRLTSSYTFVIRLSLFYVLLYGTPSSTNGDVRCLFFSFTSFSWYKPKQKRITINTQPDQLFINTGKIICKSQINCQITHAPLSILDCHLFSTGVAFYSQSPGQVSGPIIVRAS